MVTGSLALGIVGVIVVFIFAWIIYSLSVYLAARIISVNVPFLRVLIVTLIADIAYFIIGFIIMAGFLFTSNLVVLIIGLIISFVIALIIYKYLFNISWAKTFVMLIIANVIYFVIMIILVLILAALGYLALGGLFSSLSAAP